MLKTPVLFIIFNRPDTTRLSFEAIRKVRPEKLFVAADGPRRDNQEDIEKCQLTRKLIRPDWNCEFNEKYSDINLGCGKGPASAISWFFQNVEQGIILEDDCIPEQDFFFFCQELLEKYKYDSKVFNICGSNLGYNAANKSSYYFSKFMNMSGWATWRRTEENIDYNLTYWNDPRKRRNKLFKKLRYHFFDYDFNWITFWDDKIKETLENNNVTWWDYHWMLNQLQRNQLSIIPSRNLVKNIGFDNDATHTKSADHAIAFLETSSIGWPLIPPTFIKADKYYEEQYIKRNWFYSSRLSFYKTLIIIIKRTIRIILINIKDLFC